ncbi:MAG: glycosyltransferase family 39 protein [Candidatus Poribacteria bacterium]|nr:glycosyltransferase family 39 protein [Candidatus Poribacteria bacterium]
MAIRIPFVGENIKTRTLVFSLSLVVIALIPRLVSLEANWSGDEARWLRRSAQFMSAVKHGDFSETRIAYHPGVTTMWLAGLRTFFTEPRWNVENLAHARLFIGIAVYFGIGVACFLLYQLFGKWIAIGSFASLAFSPFFLAQTRRVHTDALATIFILLTVLFFLRYAQNRQNLRDLILSGIAFGLAVLSKSYAVILLLWIPICLFFFRNQDKQPGGLLTDVAEGLCFLNCAAITTLLIWPVFWNLPFGILCVYLFGTTSVLVWHLKNETLSLKRFSLGVSIATLGIICFRARETIGFVLDRVGWAVTTPHDVEHFFLGKVVYDPGWLFYIFVLSIKSTPMILPFACVAIFFLWKQRKRSEVAMCQFKSALTLVSGVVLFTVCFSITEKKFSRYLLPVFPLLEILAVIGFVKLLRFLFSHIHEQMPSLKTALTLVACSFFFFFHILPVLALCPNYGTYYNLCWKVSNITEIITTGDAAGLYLAAKYLNQLPNANQMSVQVSDLGSPYFRHYFKGRTYRTHKNHISDIDSHRHVDYEVVYIRDSQIGWVPQEGVKGGTLEHVITINGLNLAWIYRVETEGMR